MRVWFLYLKSFFFLPVSIAFCIRFWKKSNKSPLPLLFVVTIVYYKEQKSVFQMSQMLWKEQSEDSNTQPSCQYHIVTWLWIRNLQCTISSFQEKLNLKKDILFSRNFFLGVNHVAYSKPCHITVIESFGKIVKV